MSERLTSFFSNDEDDDTMDRSEIVVSPKAYAALEEVYRHGSNKSRFVGVSWFGARGDGGTSFRLHEIRSIGGIRW